MLNQDQSESFYRCAWTELKQKLHLQQNIMILKYLNQLRSFLFSFSVFLIALFSVRVQLIFHYSRRIIQSLLRVVRTISEILYPDSTAPFEELLQRWQTIDNFISDLTGRDLNVRYPAPQTNALSLYQLAGRIKTKKKLIKNPLFCSPVKKIIKDKLFFK